MSVALYPEHWQVCTLRYSMSRAHIPALSGMTSVLFTYPLDLVRVRMAFHTRSTSNGHAKPTFIHSALEILRETPKQPPLTPSPSSPSSRAFSPFPTSHPPLSAPSTSTLFTRFPLFKFYRGFTVSITGMLPYAGTSFLTWGALRAHFLPQPTDSSSPTSSSKHPNTTAIDLSIGAVAGMTSQTVSYPFEVIRRRMQVGGLTHPDRWLRWGETVRTIWSLNGWRGFYVGLSIGYLKIVPMTAVSFTVWQWAKRVLDV